MGDDASRTDRTRRWVLRAAGPALVAAVAGCAGGGDDGSTTPTPAVTPTATRTGTPTLAPTATPRATDTPTVTSTDAPTETTPAPDPESLARTLLRRLDAGEYGTAAEMFAGELARRLPPRVLEPFWEKQEWIIGGYRGIRSIQGGDGDDVTVVVDGEYGLLTVDVVATGGSITGFAVRPRSQGEYSPPAYADAEAFEEASRTVAPDGECPLPATLSVPADRDGPVPGAVLVHGSGPQDRNATIGPQRPFKDLAWGLASRGIAVLRYRKRTAECEVPSAEATLDRIAVDAAVSAVELLRDEPPVDGSRVAVLGHSQGGFAAPRIAKRSGGVAALGLLSAPGRHPWRIQYDQTRALFAFDGEVDDEEQSQLNRIRQAGPRIENGGFPPGQVVLGRPGAYWNSVADYDPVAVAADVGLPTAVLWGERDAQVFRADFEAWTAGLSDATSWTYPDCNHLLLPGSGPSYVGRYYTEPDNVSKAVIEDLAAWVPTATA